MKTFEKINGSWLKTAEQLQNNINLDRLALSALSFSTPGAADVIEQRLTAAQQECLDLLMFLQAQQNDIWEQQARLSEEMKLIEAEKDAYRLRYEQVTFQEKEYLHDLISKCYDQLQDLAQRQLRLSDVALDLAYATEVLLGERSPSSFDDMFTTIIHTLTPQLYRNAQQVLQIGDCETLQAGYVIDRSKTVTLEELRSCSGQTFFRIFEISEIDGETFAGFWEQFWEITHHNQPVLYQLKTVLITAFEEQF